MGGSTNYLVTQTPRAGHGGRRREKWGNTYLRPKNSSAAIGSVTIQHRRQHKNMIDRQTEKQTNFRCIIVRFQLQCTDCTKKMQHWHISLVQLTADICGLPVSGSLSCRATNWTVSVVEALPLRTGQLGFCYLTVFVTQNWASILSNVSWRHTFSRNTDDKKYSEHRRFSWVCVIWICTLLTYFTYLPFTKLWSITCHVGSHSACCHSTQVNMTHLNPSQTRWYSICLPQGNKRLSWPWWLVIYQNGLPVRRQSPIQAVTSWWCPDWEWNPRPRDHKSDALPLDHYAIRLSQQSNFGKTLV